MVKLVVDKHILQADKDTPLLDTLLQNGFIVPYSCRAGVCQSCLVELRKGTPTPESQQGLSTELKSRHLLLSCRCYPQGEMEIELYDPRHEQQQAQVVAITPLSSQVFKLELRCDLRFKPGQHITVWRDPQTARSYSIASLPSDDTLSLHVRLHPNGRFSQWAFESLRPESNLAFTGPTGDCYYRGDDPAQPLLLAATGTGIAPLYAIARDALNQNHSGEITMLYCGATAESLYWKTALQTLAQEHQNFTLKCLVQSEASACDTYHADAYDYVKNQVGELSRHRVFLCGAPSFVQKMRKQCFLKGGKPRAIHFDAFEPAQQPLKPVN